MLAGTLLCHAGMKASKEVTFFPSYGAEMRGGTANCKVIISDSTIGSPVFSEADILMSLNNPSFEKFYPAVRDGGIVFVNSSLFSVCAEDYNFEIIEIPANNIAEECGTVLAANLVMLGALVRKTGLLNLGALMQSVPGLLKGKKDLWDINKKALEAGYNSADSR